MVFGALGNWFPTNGIRGYCRTTEVAVSFRAEGVPPLLYNPSILQFDFDSHERISCLLPYICTMEKQQKVMLGLKLPTDPRWVDVVRKNMDEILTDHAWCEQKAASNAISTIVRFSQHADLVDEMTRIALEEMEHFQMVTKKIADRGLELGPERADPYVRDLLTFVRKGGSKTNQLVEKMLFSAMVEARSCERFRILSEELEDEDLKKFYYELMVSEANHYTTFIGFARKYGGEIDVDKRWAELLEYEGTLMDKYGKGETMHG
jgi:tRNA-(ms[2]io[6]A)-hydroxylase